MHTSHLAFVLPGTRYRVRCVTFFVRNFIKFDRYNDFHDEHIQLKHQKQKRQ